MMPEFVLESKWRFICFISSKWSRKAENSFLRLSYASLKIHLLYIFQSEVVKLRILRWGCLVWAWRQGFLVRILFSARGDLGKLQLWILRSSRSRQKLLAESALVRISACWRCCRDGRLIGFSAWLTYVSSWWLLSNRGHTFISILLYTWVFKYWSFHLKSPKQIVGLIKLNGDQLTLWTDASLE